MRGPVPSERSRFDLTWRGQAPALRSKKETYVDIETAFLSR